ncbi:Hypothetical protein D9617_71g039840 [Elsinoe fawcettii]|nr:Hypothetical protein D9617_71g039840 [Elsinoe fawcettii]
MAGVARNMPSEPSSWRELLRLLKYFAKSILPRDRSHMDLDASAKAAAKIEDYFVEYANVSLNKLAERSSEMVLAVRLSQEIGACLESNEGRIRDILNILESFRQRNYAVKPVEFVCNTASSMEKRSGRPFDSDFNARQSGLFLGTMTSVVSWRQAAKDKTALFAMLDTLQRFFDLKGSGALQLPTSDIDQDPDQPRPEHTDQHYPDRNLRPRGGPEQEAAPTTENLFSVLPLTNIDTNDVDVEMDLGNTTSPTRSKAAHRKRNVNPPSRTIRSTRPQEGYLLSVCRRAYDGWLPHLSTRDL